MFHISFANAFKIRIDLIATHVKVNVVVKVVTVCRFVQPLIPHYIIIVESGINTEKSMCGHWPLRAMNIELGIDKTS